MVLFPRHGIRRDASPRPRSNLKLMFTVIGFIFLFVACQIVEQDLVRKNYVRSLAVTDMQEQGNYDYNAFRSLPKSVEKESQKTHPKYGKDQGSKNATGAGNALKPHPNNGKDHTRKNETGPGKAPKPTPNYGNDAKPHPNYGANKNETGPINITVPSADVNYGATQNESGPANRFVGDCGTKKERDSDYRGTISITSSGAKCQRWDSQEPHRHTRTPEKYENKGLEENYCRNPDKTKGGAWCYTTGKNKRWEHCDIPSCEEMGPGYINVSSPYSNHGANRNETGPGYVNVSSASSNYGAPGYINVSSPYSNHGANRNETGPGYVNVSSASSNYGAPGYINASSPYSNHGANKNETKQDSVIGSSNFSATPKPTEPEYYGFRVEQILKSGGGFICHKDNWEKIFGKEQNQKYDAKQCRGGDEIWDGIISIRYYKKHHPIRVGHKVHEEKTPRLKLGPRPGAGSWAGGGWQKEGDIITPGQKDHITWQKGDIILPKSHSCSEISALHRLAHDFDEVKGQVDFSPEGDLSGMDKHAIVDYGPIDWGTSFSATIKLLYSTTGTEWNNINFYGFREIHLEETNDSNDYRMEEIYLGETPGISQNLVLVALSGLNLKSISVILAPVLSEGIEEGVEVIA